MKIFSLLDNIKNDYADDYLIRKNGTVLLAPGDIPKCRHMFFAPLSDEIIEEYLISQYKHKFPDEIISFLKYSNGANLFWTKVTTEKFSLAHSMLTILGLPLKPPFSRPLDMEEPFDIRIEDLSRHDDIPETWLKCGSYTKDYNFSVTNDIFIDTVTGQVFACQRDHKDIVDTWKSFDECLCSIYETLVGCHTEYLMD